MFDSLGSKSSLNRLEKVVMASLLFADFDFFVQLTHQSDNNMEVCMARQPLSIFSLTVCAKT